MKLYDNDGFRKDFMSYVYSVLADDPTNDRANQIISAFDMVPPMEVLPVEIPFAKLAAMHQRSVYVVNWADPSLSGWAVIRTETTLDHQLLWLKFLDRRKEQVNLTEDKYRNPWVPCYREPVQNQSSIFVSGDRYQRLKADYEELKRELDELRAGHSEKSETA